MGLIVCRPEHHAKIAARALVHSLEKTRLRTLAAPLRTHGNAPSIGKREAGDVNGVGVGVLAAPASQVGIADDVATGEGAKAQEANDALAQELASDRLHVVLEPERERRCRFTGKLVDASATSAPMAPT